MTGDVLQLARRRRARPAGRRRRWRLTRRGRVVFGAFGVLLLAGVGSLVGHEADAPGLPRLEDYVALYCARTGRARKRPGNPGFTGKIF